MFAGLLVAGADDAGKVVLLGIVGKALERPCRAVALADAVAVHQVAGLRDVTVVLTRNVAHAAALQLLDDGSDTTIHSYLFTLPSSRTPHGLAHLGLDDEGLRLWIVIDRRVMGDAREARHILTLQVGLQPRELLVVAVDGEEGYFI